MTAKPQLPVASGLETKTGLDGKAGLYDSYLGENRTVKYHAKEGVEPLAYAFDRKVAVHAGMGGHPVERERIPALLTELRSKRRTGPTAAYIHIPFCQTHCLYCGFFNRKHDPEAAKSYVRSLIREIESEADTPAVASGPVHAVYFGGGTPTALDPDDLRALLTTVRRCLPLANDCEITIEGRLHDFGPDKMEACLTGGANRFSIGVQSFDTALRRSMGRIRTREEAFETLRTLVGYDQAAVVIDLIYGLPGQDMALWERDLADFLSLGLHGVDLYQLNVFRGSPLMKAIESGRLPAAADVPEQSRRFARGVELMTAAGCGRLSISHWGVGTRERNLYNLTVKGRAHCLHYGAGAGGNLFDHFAFNESDVTRYQAAIEDGRKPLAMIAEPPANVALTKAVTSGLERLRLDVAGLSRELGADYAAMWGDLLRQWERAGLLRYAGGAVDLTLAGQFWEVNLAQALIDFTNNVQQCRGTENVSQIETRQ